MEFSNVNIQLLSDGLIATQLILQLNYFVKDIKGGMARSTFIGSYAPLRPQDENTIFMLD